MTSRTCDLFSSFLQRVVAFCPCVYFLLYECWIRLADKEMMLLIPKVSKAKQNNTKHAMKFAHGSILSFRLPAWGDGKKKKNTRQENSESGCRLWDHRLHPTPRVVTGGNRDTNTCSVSSKARHTHKNCQDFLQKLVFLFLPLFFFFCLLFLFTYFLKLLKCPICLPV